MSGEKLAVLVVDDSLTIRAMMTQVLQKDPAITTVAAASAAEAERLLADHAIDVITLDVHMPGMSGLDYLASRRRRHDIPVIMLSASTGRGAEVRTAALLGGAAACFDKADAVRRADELIRLVKDAARRRARLDREDAQAVATARAEAAA